MRTITSVAILFVGMVVPALAQDPVLRVSVRYDAVTKVNNLTTQDWNECTLRYGASKAAIGTLYVRGAVQVSENEFTPRLTDRPDPAKAVVTCKRDGKEITATLGPPPVETGAPARLSPPASPVSSGPDASIRAKCAKDWPEDFVVRAYCEKQQHAAAEALSARTMASANEQTIRRKCATDWPDDYMVRNYCEQQQLKALQSLSR